MKGLKSVVVAQKKPNPEMLKKRKADLHVKKEKASKKNPGAPKRPPSAFFVFMADFRKSYKENFPDNKSVAAVSKAGGEKWKSMSESEKAPYQAKAAKCKAEHGKAMEDFKNGNGEGVKAAESDKSSSKINDNEEPGASTSSTSTNYCS